MRTFYVVLSLFDGRCHSMRLAKMEALDALPVYDKTNEWIEFIQRERPAFKKVVLESIKYDEVPAGNTPASIPTIIQAISDSMTRIPTIMGSEIIAARATASP